MNESEMCLLTLTEYFRKNNFASFKVRFFIIIIQPQKFSAIMGSYTLWEYKWK